MTKLSNSQFKKIFDKAAKDYDNVSNFYSVTRRIEFIVKNSKGKCLEIGAGTGEISKALIENSNEVVATDISPKMVQKIKKKLDIKAVCCDAESLPFRKNSFDTVIASEVIYYLDSPHEFLIEAYRVLKPKGRLLITSASDASVFYDKIRSILRFLGISSMYFDDGNVSFMSKEKITNLLRSSNFHIKLMQSAILIPYSKFDFINRYLERTYLSRLCVFNYFLAVKNK